MRKVACLAALVLAGVLISAKMPAQNLAKPASFYPNKMVGRAKIACDYETNVVFGHKVEMADQYLTPNFHAHHNLQQDTKNITEQKGWLSASAARAKASNTPPDPQPNGCGGPTINVVIEQGDYVVFVRSNPVPDPNDK